MPRGRYQTGHLRKQGKRVTVWKGYYYLYRTDGTTKHTSVTLGRVSEMSNADAQRKLQAIIDERTRQPIPMDTYTVRSFALDVWWPIMAKRWERNTVNSNRSLVHRHILPALGDLPLNQVDRIKIDQFLQSQFVSEVKNATAEHRKNRALQSSGECGREIPANAVPGNRARREPRRDVVYMGVRPMGDTPQQVLQCGGAKRRNAKSINVDVAAARLGRPSIARLRATLHRIFSYALDCGAIARNPVQGSLLPGQPGNNRQDVLTLDEARQVMHATTGKARVLFGLMLGAGLRLGECLALRWNDVKPDRLTIDEASDGARVKSTKTRRVREVPLSVDLHGWLVALRAGAVYNLEDDFIFGTANNTPVCRQSADSSWLDQARRESGVQRLTFQVCRRTFATLIKTLAETRDIQAMLGHSSAQTTLGHYVQPTSDTQRAAVDQLWKGMVQ